MKNIQFNYSKYCKYSRDLDLFETIKEDNGSILIQRKQIKEILPRLDFFDFDIEVGDIFLIYSNSYIPEYYDCIAPKDWPQKYAKFKLEPGIYHIRITNIYSGYVFFVFEEIENCIESCVSIREDFPSSWYFDIKDLPESNIEYIDIYSCIN